MVKTSGPVRAGTLYQLEEAKLQLGKSVFAALRAARRKGLPLPKIIHRRYIRGSDLLEWINAAKSLVLTSKEH